MEVAVALEHIAKKEFIPVIADSAVQQNAMSVFDVQRIRDVAYQFLWGLGDYVACVAMAFLIGVSYAVRAGGELVWVKRQNMCRSAYSRCRSFRQMDARTRCFVSVDLRAAPADLIAPYDAVVLKPFTSTACLAMAFGKPSGDFDFLHDVIVDDRVVHGVVVLQCQYQLIAWLLRISKSASTEVRRLAADLQDPGRYPFAD